MEKPIIETVTPKRLAALRRETIQRFGTIDELREKESIGTITPAEATALDDLEGFDFLERTF